MQLCKQFLPQLKGFPIMNRITLILNKINIDLNEKELDHIFSIETFVSHAIGFISHVWMMLYNWHFIALNYSHFKRTNRKHGLNLFLTNLCNIGLFKWRIWNWLSFWRSLLNQLSNPNRICRETECVKKLNITVKIIASNKYH